MIGLLSIGLGLAPAAGTWADDHQLETLVLNGGRTWEGTIVDANRNTVAIRNSSGVAQFVRADDIQTVYIQAKDPDGQPFFGSFVSWKDGVYRLNMNFQLVSVRDGELIGEPVPVADSRPVPARPEEPSVDGHDKPVPRLAALQDDQVPSLNVEIADVVEGQSHITYSLILSASVERKLFVAYGTIDGTARAGEDYEASRDVLVIPAGERRAEINVPLIDDGLVEDDESLTLTIAASTDAVRLSRTRIESVITDND